MGRTVGAQARELLIQYQTQPRPLSPDSRGIEQRRGSPQYLKGKGEPGLHQFCSISRVDLWFNGFVHYDSITIV
jgi:hypothetical protein